MATSRQRWLNLRDLQPSLEIAGCWRFDHDPWMRYRIPSHHLLLMVSGIVQAKTPTESFAAGAGELICFRPTELNEYGTKGPTLMYQAQVQFAPPPRHRDTPWLDGVGPVPVRLALGDRFDEARALFEIFCIELAQSGAAHELRLRAAVYELLAIVAGIGAGGPRRVQRIDPWQRVRQQLDSSLDASVQVRELARRMGLSTDHFIRQFKRRFRLSPKAYHMQARLREAARLLRGTDKPVKSIAYGLGFNSPKTFTRAFKRHLQVKPTDLRSSMDFSFQTLAAPTEGGLFRINEHVLPPHAGPDYLRRWTLRKHA